MDGYRALNQGQATPQHMRHNHMDTSPPDTPSACAGGSEEGLPADADELDVELQGRAGRDVGRRAALAVCRAAQRQPVGAGRPGAGCVAGRFWFDLLARTCEVGRASQCGLLALAHLEHSLRRGPVGVSAREGRRRPCWRRRWSAAGKGCEEHARSPGPSP